MKYFKAYELVDMKTYKILGEESLMLFDRNLLEAVDIFREIFGKTIINDWKFGGEYQWSGLRTKDCNIGAEYSLHRFGKAVDLHHDRIDDIKFRLINIILDKEKPMLLEELFLKRINAIEKNTIGWLHVDTRNLDYYSNNKLIYSKNINKYFLLF